MKSMQERVPSSFGYTTEETKCRLRELILYIAVRCKEHENFGAMKLNKILFFSDFISYFRYGESISGSQYQKLLQGPVPVRLFPLREEMIAAGDIEIHKEKISFRTQQRVIPLRQPNLDMFTEQVIDLLNEIIDDLEGRPAGDVPNGFGWEVAELREIIPYEAILLDDRSLQRQDVEGAHRLIQEQGWGRV